MNPKYISAKGPTKHLLNKLEIFQKFFFRNLPNFCGRYILDPIHFSIDSLFLVGSNIQDAGWTNNSDTDFVIVNSLMTPEYLWKYKEEVLDPLLCKGKKSEWIDVFFATDEYKVLHPRYELTDYLSTFTHNPINSKINLPQLSFGGFNGK